MTDVEAIKSGELQGQFSKHQAAADLLSRQHDEWISRRNVLMELFRDIVHESLDRAFGELQTMLRDVLACTDAELNSLVPVGQLLRRTEDGGSLEQVRAAWQRRHQAIWAISRARFAFKELKDTSESLYKALCTLSQEGAGQLTDLVNCRNAIVAFLAGLKAQLGIEESARNLTLEQFATANGTALDYEAKIRSYDESSFISKWFTADAHELYDGVAQRSRNEANNAEWAAQRMAKLIGLIRNLDTTSDDLSHRLEEDKKRTEKEETAIIEAKMRASTLFSSMYDLENGLASRGIELTVEDAVRHVLKVVYISVEMVDSDEHVREIKGNMLEAVAAKYGREKTEELKKEKKLLAFDFTSTDEDVTAHAEPVSVAQHLVEWCGWPRVEENFHFPFQSAAAGDQCLTMLKQLDFSTGTNVRIDSDVRKDEARARISTWGGTRINSAKIGCLSVSPSDMRFQAGSCSIDFRSHWAQDLTDADAWVCTTQVRFDRFFACVPSVRLFLSRFDAEHCSPGRSLNMTSWAENVSAQGFTLCTKVWDGRTDLWGLSFQWLAHDPRESSVRSGEVKFDAADWSQGIDGEVLFDRPMPKGPPSVLLMGIAGMECNFDRSNLRYRALERDVTASGFAYEAGTWDAESLMKHGRWHWIAIE